ncbi:MAG: efflux RND transporter periplasmic adaptor subunit [Burkholderiaceae bacterium]
MKRWMKWLLPVLAVLLVGGFVLRAIQAKKLEQARLAVPLAAPRVDLAPTDVLTLRKVVLARTLEVSGGLKAVNSAYVKARVAGELRTLTVREGDSVRAGQVLGQIDATELEWRLRQAEQSAAATRTQFDIARRALENNRALVAQGFISATGLETSVSNEAAAQANLQAAAAGVGLARKARADAALVAPIAGFVSQRLVQAGERVAIDTRIVEIVDLTRLELEAALTPEDVAGLTPGRTATLRVDGLATPVAASVTRINPSAQAGSRSVLAYLAVQGQPALRQGLFARGTIELDRREVLALPLSAVRTDASPPYVQQVIDGRIARTPVQLGSRGDVGGQPWVEIAGGVADGARIVAGTAGSLREGTAVRLPETVAMAEPTASPAPMAPSVVSVPPVAPVAASATAPR